MNIIDRTAEFDSEDISANKSLAFLAYIPILFFLPLVSSPNSKFGRFHANQGLLLLLGGFANSIVYLVPIIGWIVGPLIGLALFILFLFGFINTMNGYAKELPFIGSIRIIK